MAHISVALSGMGVSSGGWFLHRIGISIILATLCFVREIQTIIQTSVCIRSVFPVQNKGWQVLYIMLYIMHVLNIYIYIMHVLNIYTYITVPHKISTLTHYLYSHCTPFCSSAGRIFIKVAHTCLLYRAFVINTLVMSSS